MSADRALLSDRFRCHGKHYCQECAPAKFLNYVPIERAENYFSVNLGHTREFHEYVTVTLDGEPCGSVCHEEMAGPRGWVGAFMLNERNTFHVCACKRGVCVRRIPGFVSVRLGPRRAA